MANANDWGLTARGFKRPSYAELLDAFEFQARDKFTIGGKAPVLTVRSPLGIFLRIWAWVVNLLFQLLEDIYNSRFVDTAVGASLYQLGRNIGLKLLPAQRASGYVDVRGSPGVVIPAGWLVSTISAIQYTVVISGTISPDGIATVPIQCMEYGVIGNVPADTIREIVNPLEGIDSVTNPAPTDGGRARETDEQFRDRYYRSVDFAGGVNADAIQAEILQRVEGVLAARVYENDTNVTDGRGLPPNSIEAVVYSGLDTEVAAAIYRRKAAGIQTYGGSMVEIVSPQNGQVYGIRFTRPAPVPIWIQLDNVAVNHTLFPADGVDRIKAALIEYIGSDITGGLNIEEDVIFIQLPRRALSVPGVVDFDMTISVDGTAFSQENIPINEREKAVSDTDKITVALSMVPFSIEGWGV